MLIVRRPLTQCPCNSNTKLCDERGGDRVGIENIWKNKLEGIGYVDYNEEKEITHVTVENIEIEELEIMDKNKSPLSEFSNYNKNKSPLSEFSNYIYDGLVVLNLPEDILKEFLKNMYRTALMK